MSAAFPPVKGNIYILPSPRAPAPGVAPPAAGAGGRGLCPRPAPPGAHSPLPRGLRHGSPRNHNSRCHREGRKGRKCLDGIRGSPRSDDLGAVIIHLIGAWGKLLDREMELNQPRKGARQGCVGELASLAIFKRFHLRISHKTQSYFIHLVWWPFALLRMNIKFEMALQQHILESVLWAVICMVGLVSRLLTF